MKTELTIEQSQHLIDLGVSKEKASLQVLFSEDGPFDIWNEDMLARPIFSFSDFLNGEILPKEIGKGDYVLTMYGNVVGYAFDVEYEGLIWNVSFGNAELIDALYQLACWYYGEYLKSEEK